MTRAFVFPGQGSQAVGMGKELADAFPEARLVFEEVDETLKQNLSRVMFEGPKDQLVLTANAQPALMAMSVAIVRVIEKEGNLTLLDIASYVAGHSLGEYSALTVAGALSLADTSRLLKLRGTAMQIAVPIGEGAMAALMGPSVEETEEIAAAAVEMGADGEVCDVANDNAPGQVVVSGSTATVERAVEIGAERGAKRSVMLPVSAPFHCGLMQPAADAMENALRTTTISPPSLPIITNVSADEVRDPEVIRKNLVMQVTARVRWRESVMNLKNKEVDTLVEAGAGKVLSGLARRIDREFLSISIQGPEDIEAFLASL
ncbi:MAG: [acyl-carrier-protein] S-malonyltransferase [Rickettsiales bacterium]|nr:[acyl-carrier-protein] S-malonyltransferase [Rickettsiales bacterium]